MNTVYKTQRIEPVIIRCATILTEEQKNRIKDKMKAKTGATDIKLICEHKPSLRAGFQMEWGFTDPEALLTPTDGVDLSFSNVVKKKALAQGIPVEV